MKHPSYLHSDNPRVPAAKHPFVHCQSIQMRFNDLDMFGHVNNNVYLSYMDLAKINYFRSINPYKDRHTKVDAVVVHIDTDFYSPSYFGDELEVWTAVTCISKRSFHLEQRVVNATTGETKCIGRTVMAGFDIETATSKPLDPMWVDAIEAYEGHALQCD